MTGQRPPRVRVTGPPRRTRPRTAAADVEDGTDDDTELAEVYLSSLLREQGRLAVGVVLLLLLAVGSLPLAFHLLPGLTDLRVAGVSLAWALLGVAVYPLLVGLGLLYVRRAERNERDFADVAGVRRRR